MNEPKYAIATEMRKRDGAQNQDCAAAERLLMADGNFAYVAAIADGVSCCDRPREAASLAISHFRRAIEDSSIQELADSSMRARWLDSWTNMLDEDAASRARDGYATFCALVVIPYPGDAGYGVLSLNVGDSSSFLVTPHDSRCISMKPDDGGRHHSGDDGLLRGVGLDHRGFPLMDCDYREFGAGFSGYFWVGCDGVFNFVAGSDLREICTCGKYAFRELPQLALSMSMAEGRRQEKKSMDNATAAVVGVNVPEAATVLPPPPAPPPSSPWSRIRAGFARCGASLAGIPARIWLAAVLLALAAAVALWLAAGGRRPEGGDTVPPAPPTETAKPDASGDGAAPAAMPQQEPVKRVPEDGKARADATVNAAATQPKYCAMHTSQWLDANGRCPLCEAATQPDSNDKSQEADGQEEDQPSPQTKAPETESDQPASQIGDADAKDAADKE